MSETTVFVDSGLSAPYCLEFDSSGNLYCSNNNINNIVKITITPDGPVVSNFATGFFPFAGLSFDNSGNLYSIYNNFFSFPLRCKIIKFPPSGVVGSIIYNGSDSTDSNKNNLAIDSFGFLYFGNSSEIKKITTDGSPVSTFASELRNPSNLTFDSAGNLYFSNGIYEFTDITIQKITPDGETVSTFFTFDSGLRQPAGLACDSDGNLYCSMPYSNTIQKITSNGETISTFVPSDSVLNSPLGLVFDSAGNLYCANSGNNTITKTSSAPLVPPTITNFSIPTKTYGDSSFNIIDPSSNSNGAFSYTSSNTSVATISGNTITITGAGNSVITATQSATDEFASGDISANFLVNQENPSITNFSIPSETYLDTSFSIQDPSSNSTGAFNYVSSNTSVARISGNTVQIVGIGSSTITANQDASGNYASGDVSANLISNICFPAGTPINTDQGLIAIEKINPEIHTIRSKKIIGITKTKSTNDFLVCIEKHALGNNIPSQKTFITRDHGVFYNGKMRRSVELIELSDNIYKVKYNGEILYNVLMEQHDKMVVNNLICETLNPENPIAKLYNKIQKCNPEQQERLIKQYNEFIIKNNKFTKKQLNQLK